ncbi:MAG TPA: SCO family protein [Rhodocyclaceae bacterium]|mgnify:FL=1|nr:SCO family protein [Betaproteobacteria bacterium]HMV00948.1 SCO family protein [Rhodocyclaceae bacterium]HMV22076.1 SCO family protein [Rhodocyclaceae bacterium]HMW76852.1 SCO family protein [Rhodocyclaceae bacterium]HNE43811.1 SCO family protein [Rhodocyclaceae bacterium]
MHSLVLFLVLIAALVGCQPEPPAFRATDISGGTFGKRLDLTDHDGRSRSLEDFRGKAVVLFFGYTSCPDVCPTTLARYGEVMKVLGPDADRVQVLFVTLDPRRDDAARLKAFVPWFDPRFIGLYGDEAKTAAVAKEFLIHSAVKEVGGGLGYVLDHSAGSYVFDPAGRLRLYVRDGAAVQDIVADLRLLLAGR